MSYPNRRFAFLAVCLLVLGATPFLACQKSDPAPSAGVAAAPSTEAPGATAAPVSTIVFVEKEGACDCTRRRIDTSWAALETALGDRKVPVQRLRVDVEEAAVEPYRDKRAFVVLPALYFLDATGNIVEQLQGEVTPAQVTAALGAAPAE